VVQTRNDHVETVGAEVDRCHDLGALLRARLLDGGCQWSSLRRRTKIRNRTSSKHSDCE
jgi:hypothetical protein